MTTITATNAAPFGAITTFRAIHAVETAINSLIAWNANRQTYKALSTLTLRELDDIGLAPVELQTRLI
jgi:uncharacterized protein YjiS (DUF1127 family)